MSPALCHKRQPLRQVPEGLVRIPVYWRGTGLAFPRYNRATCRRWPTFAALAEAGGARGRYYYYGESGVVRTHHGQDLKMKIRLKRQESIRPQVCKKRKAGPLVHSIERMIHPCWKAILPSF